jgi:hypothetical protein
MTKRVQQEHKHGCAVAAMAMVTGKSYAEVFSAFDPEHYDFERHGLSHFPIADYLAGEGYALRKFTRCDQRLNVTREPWPVEPFTDVHICEVVNSVMCHMVVMLGDGTVLDPAVEGPRRLSDYLAVHYVAGVYKVAQTSD